MATEDERQRLSDIEAIKQLRARYTRAVDTKDWALYGDSLAEDAHLSTERGEDDGREHIVEVISQALAPATTVHHVHSPEIELTGPDTASGIWAMNDLVDFPTFAIRGWGHYRETYVRTDDGWKIQTSTLTRLKVDMEGEVPSRG